MKTTELCSPEYNKAVNMFKKSCCIADLTGSARESLEECIAGLKQVMTNDDGECGLKVCHLMCVCRSRNASFQFDSVGQSWLSHFTLVPFLDIYTDCV